MSAHSVTGGWLGTYAYEPVSGRAPCRFEATFTTRTADGGFGGRILDDGYLAEARVVEGIQAGDTIRFLKIYLRGGSGPVTYEGTLSEDGRLLTGQWRLPLQGETLSGAWEAQRLWWDETSAERRQAEQESLMGRAAH